MFPSVNSRICILMAVVLLLGEFLWAHGPGGQGSGRRRMVRGVSGAAVQESPNWENDTTVNFMLDAYSYGAMGWSSEGNVPHALGTGGRMGEYLNANLYSDGSIDFSNSSSLQKRRLETSYGDFGYIPTWQPTQGYVRLQNRIISGLWSAASMSYSGDYNQFGDQIEAGNLNISELLLLWKPHFVEGSLVRFGMLQMGTGFSSMFGTSPMSFAMNGIQLTHSLEFGLFSEIETSLAAGTSFSGFTVRHNADLGTVHEGYFLTGRQKSHLYGDVAYRYMDKFYIQASGGYQHLPADTSTFRNYLENVITQKFVTANGWHVALEAGFAGKNSSHGLIATHGKGDVELGWGAPLFVAYDHLDSITRLEDSLYFSRKDSRSTNLMYSFNYRIPWFSISAGAHWMWQQPGKHTRKVVDPNFEQFNSPSYGGFDPDSVFYKDGIIISDSLTLTPKDFRALKMAIQPTLRFYKFFTVGFRYDYIHYLDPNAHSNTTEVLVDNAMVSLFHPRAPLDAIRGPSKWELEAVNSHVVSPNIGFMFGNHGRLDFTHSMGFYDEIVTRHGVPDKFHQNFIVRGTLYFSVKK